MLKISSEVQLEQAELVLPSSQLVEISKRTAGTGTGASRLVGRCLAPGGNRARGRSASSGKRCLLYTSDAADDTP
eukprot:4214830-Pyramimonas_sp.AAC.1